MTAILSPIGSRPEISARPPSHLRRWHGSGLSFAALDRQQLCELSLTLTPTPGETIEGMIARLADVLEQEQAKIARQFVFGTVSAHGQMMRELRRRLGEVQWPVTWVEGAAGDGKQIAGIEIHAISGAPVESVLHKGRIVGRLYDDGQARHCLFGGLGPEHVEMAPPEQARETFEILEGALDQAGMSLKDVARTWLYLDDLLSWYAPFNRERNAFFARHGLQAGMFPASTGISGRNPRGAAITAAAWAVQPYDSPARVCPVPSPKQCPAIAYGSAFSRAVEIVSARWRRVLVSGTASIAPDGRTARVGDARRQIDLTMEVVGSILRSRGMALNDMTRATAYFKRAEDFPLFDEWRNQNGLDSLPVISTQCGICRDDLLFELEADAARGG